MEKKNPLSGPGDGEEAEEIEEEGGAETIRTAKVLSGSLCSFASSSSCPVLVLLAGVCSLRPSQSGAEP